MSKRPKASERPDSADDSKASDAVGGQTPVRTRSDDAYTVVARRYRPQCFEDVVGQDHVVRALRNAIRLNRIAQAYLFCGTRGVGKTSMARIFAKCLNCVQGPTEEPCQVCDICQSIALGQDVDVIEIDGATNNGVEQVRELRQNAALRPSRARYKIYYIDEVHMLTIGAFNALLKTLEEPPAHVKFLFATTEANKIPITVLSRCQRYDFAGITPEVIAQTLGEICQQERVQAEPEALQVVARRASGSLRDAQSLLDRLLASGSSLLSVEVVNALLGTASDERLLAMLEALADHDPAAALQLLEQSAGEGVQPAEILAGMIEFTRDAMVLAIGADSLLMAVTPRQRPRVVEIIKRWSTESILAAFQILDECRRRMRGSLHGRLLVELALVRIARLEDLTKVGALIERLAALESGGPLPRRTEPSHQRRVELPPEPAPGPSPAPAVERPAHSPAEPAAATPADAPPARRSTARGSRSRADSRATPPGETTGSGDSGATATLKSNAVSLEPASHDAVSSPATAADYAAALDLATAQKVWPDVIKQVGATLAWRLSQVEPVAVISPDVLVIAATGGYNSAADDCGTAESLEKISQALQRLTHKKVTVKYERSIEVKEPPADARTPDLQRQDALASDPLVRRVLELFEARPHHFEHDDPGSN